ncbi:MAG: hypothetical protein ACOCP7_02345, partial [Desulfohalobiaceae bacterium]
VHSFAERILNRSDILSLWPEPPDLVNSHFSFSYPRTLPASVLSPAAFFGQSPTEWKAITTTTTIFPSPAFAILVVIVIDMMIFTSIQYLSFTKN